MTIEFGKLATDAGIVLRTKGLSIATAESCTGGWIAKALTDVPGSSQWFERGFLTYSNAAKTDMLGVPTALIEQHGAVSQAVVEAMALGAVQHSRAHIAVAVTGIAGPGGGTPDKPVGTVWMAWASGNEIIRATRKTFAGHRQDIRAATVSEVLRTLPRLVAP